MSLHLGHHCVVVKTTAKVDLAACTVGRRLFGVLPVVHVTVAVCVATTATVGAVCRSRS